MEYKYIVKTFRYKGKQYKVYGKTLEEALEKRLELKSRLLEGETIKYTPTVEKWLETALNAYKPNVSGEYLYQMEKRIEKHILPEIGHMKIQDVTPLQCQEIMNAQSGKSASHIAKLKQELFFIFDTARKNKLIKENPAADIVTPQGQKGKRRSLTAYERLHFLKVTEGREDFLIFRLMLFCGLRSSEAMEICYEDIVSIQGIDFFHVRGTKTKAADRLIPIPKELTLDRSRASYIALTSSNVKYTKSSYRRAVERLKRELNVSMGAVVFRNQLITHPLAEDFTPYFLRHTFCTDLKKKGVDIRLAKELMGHADIKVTADIYDHADDESAVLAAIQMGIK